MRLRSPRGFTLVELLIASAITLAILAAVLALTSPASEVFLVQLGGWCFRFATFYMLLEAFNVGGSVKNVLLVLGVNAVSAAVPFTPQGAGVQQALLVKVFAGTAAGSTVAAYSVGQQIAIGALTFGIGFAALVFIFRVRSFKEIIRRGRADRAEEAATRRTDPGRTAGDAARG